jgi:crotonobetainyl-CoA:carnitine CoA-transferase CaiB-like acyl-CoA transferase
MWSKVLQFLSKACPTIQVDQIALGILVKMGPKLQTDKPTLGLLAGIKVVDLTRGMAGAIATMLLADYGADALKVEHPSGSELESSPAYRVWNREKSIALDLEELDSLAAAVNLAQGADVLLESFRPGVAERLGLGYQSVKELNPSIIYCSISAFGPRGPWAQRHGYEGLVSAASGIMTDQVGVRDGPMFSSVPIVS